MYIKKLMKKQLSLSAATLLLIVFIVFGSSYALFENTQVDTKEQQLNVGDLVIAFKNASDTDLSDADAINITDIDPMTDAEGLTQTDNLYSFVIKNMGTIAYEYTVKLIDNPDYLSGGASYDSSKVLLSHNYIRCNLNGLNDTKTINNETFALGDKTNNIITRFVVNPGETISYALRLWVADATEYQLPNEAIGAEIHLNILIEGEASDYGYQMANLVKNGDFSDGSANWSNDSMSKEPLNDVGDWISDGCFATEGQNKIFQYFSTVATHKVYVKTNAEVEGYDDDKSAGFHVYNEDETVAAGYVFTEDDIFKNSNGYGFLGYDYSLMYTATSEDQYLSLGRTDFVRDGKYLSGPYYYFNVLVVDLTETFGAGNEPTKEWCDENIEWFDGSKIMYKY